MRSQHGLRLHKILHVTAEHSPLHCTVQLVAGLHRSHLGACQRGNMTHPLAILTCWSAGRHAISTHSAAIQALVHGKACLLHGPPASTLTNSCSLPPGIHVSVGSSGSRGAAAARGHGRPAEPLGLWGRGGRVLPVQVQRQSHGGALQHRPLRSALSHSRGIPGTTQLGSHAPQSMNRFAPLSRAFRAVF